MICLPAHKPSMPSGKTQPASIGPCPVMLTRQPSWLLWLLPTTRQASQINSIKSTALAPPVIAGINQARKLRPRSKLFFLLLRDCYIRNRDIVDASLIQSGTLTPRSNTRCRDPTPQPASESEFSNKPTPLPSKLVQSIFRNWSCLMYHCSPYHQFRNRERMHPHWVWLLAKRLMGDQ